MEFNSAVFDDWQKSLSFIDPFNNYIFSYPELLQATNCLAKNFGEKSVPMVAHLVYGWMPKILTYSRKVDQDKEIFKATTASNQAEAYGVVEKIQFPPTNNAWVGMSKTLHFLNPNLFPIWDSKVAKVLGVSPTKMGKKEVYLDYMNFTFSNMNEPFVGVVQEEFKSKTNYEISKVRAVEFTLFVMGEN